MVWCCGPVEALTPEEQTANHNKNGTYPAQRREYVPPNGNALIAGSPPNTFGHEGEDLVTGKSYVALMYMLFLELVSHLVEIG